MIKIFALSGNTGKYYCCHLINHLNSIILYHLVELFMLLHRIESQQYLLRQIHVIGRAIALRGV